MIRYTLRALHKLEEIADTHSSHVLDEIERVIELASQLPAPGIAAAHRPGVRRVRAFKFLIYVRHEPEGLVVLRIEHTSRQEGRF